MKVARDWTGPDEARSRTTSATMDQPVTPGRTTPPPRPTPAPARAAHKRRGPTAKIPFAATRGVDVDVPSASASAATGAREPPMPSRVLVVGGGRVGAYLARALKDGGVPHVVLKMSNRNRARVHAPGKTEPRGDAVDPTRTGATAIATHAGATCVTAYEDLPEVCDGHESRAHFDLVFVAVKTYALRAVREEMEASHVTFDAIVAAHNGMVEPVFDPSLTARASMPQSWDIVKDDGEPCGYRMVVRNEDKPWVLPATTIGERFASVLGRCGIRAVAAPDFEYLLLEKYFINGVANLLSVVGDVNCDGLLANRGLTARAHRLFDEMMDALAVDHAAGLALAPANFRDVVFAKVASYGAHYPSSKQDFDAGSALEIDSLNGYVVKRARVNGLIATENEALVNEVRRMVEARDAARDAAAVPTSA